PHVEGVLVTDSVSAADRFTGTHHLEGLLVHRALHTAARHTAGDLPGSTDHHGRTGPPWRTAVGVDHCGQCAGFPRGVQLGHSSSDVTHVPLPSPGPARDSEDPTYVLRAPRREPCLPRRTVAPRSLLVCVYDLPGSSASPRSRTIFRTSAICLWDPSPSVLWIPITGRPVPPDRSTHGQGSPTGIWMSMSSAHDNTCVRIPLIPSTRFSPAI